MGFRVWSTTFSSQLVAWSVPWNQPALKMKKGHRAWQSGHLAWLRGHKFGSPLSLFAAGVLHSTWPCRPCQDPTWCHLGRLGMAGPSYIWRIYQIHAQLTWWNWLHPVAGRQVAFDAVVVQELATSAGPETGSGGKEKELRWQRQDTSRHLRLKIDMIDAGSKW